MSPSPRVRLFGGVLALCLAVLGALLPASAAHAAGRQVQGGRLDWGVKASFQRYITGPVAKGGYALTGGAATLGSAFRFHSAAGTYDGGTGAFTASFSGGVRFAGHKQDNGTYTLDMTISRPTVRIQGRSGTLHVDMVSKDRETGRVSTYRQVAFATLSLGSIDMKGGGDRVVLTNLPATLTAAGARAFAGFYAAGTPLDPVSLSADVKPAATKAPKSSTDGGSAPTKSDRGDKDKAGKADKGGKKSEGRLVDGVVDWGVRRTFREYVVGDIAKGTWTLSGGAKDGGALFRFPDGKGTFRDGVLKASFDGAVRFTGELGLDLTLSGVRVTAENGTGTLHADVRSERFSGEKVPLITFAARNLTAEKGLVVLSEAPAKLTAEGAKAFGGMYQAGTEMDPVTVAVALTDDARLPALPDLGSDVGAPGAAPSASASPKASAERIASDGAASSDAGGVPVLPIGLTAGGLLLAAGAFAVFRRRRPAPAAHTPGED